MGRPDPPPSEARANGGDGAAGPVLVAPDSFKGTFSAIEVAAALASGLAAVGLGTDCCPVADGGEGTMEAILATIGGETVSAPAHDPLRRPIDARFGRLSDGVTAIVEVAAATGLPLLGPGERDAERADSYGTGELIAAAIDSGAKRVLIAAGGSASTDGGRAAIDAIEDRGGLRGATLEVLCDVDSCFEEAADNFAPQKGADEASTARLGARLSRFAAELPRDPRGIPMGGCAGGLSGGLMAAYDAELRPGAEFILDMVSFDARLAAGAAAITGEGRLDEQSGRGKIVGEIAKRCAAADAELFIVVGHDASRGDTYPAQVAAAILEASTLTEIEAAGATIGARIRT